MRDFFISYNSADKVWAEWIAWTLEAAGYTTVVQAWDFGVGTNFVLEMHTATINCESTVVVLSADYLAALFTQPEWAAAFAQDPLGQGRKLLPVRVAACQPPGLLRAIVLCDLVGLDKDRARDALLQALKGGRNKPSQEVTYPGSPPGQLSVSDDIAAARELIDLLRATWTTFRAQARIRDQLVESAIRRLEITERLEFEPFFNSYFDQLNSEEKRLHATMRGYTAGVLQEYNAQVLEVLGRAPDLSLKIPSLSDLKSHLVVWLAKCRSVFTSSPEMCLVYTGVEEKVPFPSTVEQDLKTYLSGSDRKLTPRHEVPLDRHRSSELIEEHSPYVSMKDLQAKMDTLIAAFETLLFVELAKLSTSGPAERPALLSRILDYQVQYSNHITDKVVPGFLKEFEANSVLSDLKASLATFKTTKTRMWNEQVKSTVQKIEEMLAKEGSTDWKVRVIVPALPVLLDWERRNDLSSGLQNVWERLIAVQKSSFF